MVCSKFSMSCWDLIISKSLHCPYCTFLFAPRLSQLCCSSVHKIALVRKRHAIRTRFVFLCCYLERDARRWNGVRPFVFINTQTLLGRKRISDASANNRSQGHFADWLPKVPITSAYIVTPGRNLTSCNVHALNTTPNIRPLTATELWGDNSG